MKIKVALRLWLTLAILSAFATGFYVDRYLHRTLRVELVCHVNTAPTGTTTL